MFELEDFKYIMPEDIDENHITTLSKSTLLQYKISLQKSNRTSNTLLKDAWQANQELLDDEAMNIIVKSARALLNSNNDNNNRKTWKCSLSKYDPEALFSQSVKKCNNCSTTPTKYDLDQFNRNICTCDLGLPTSNTDSNAAGSRKGPFVEQSSECSSQESKSDNEKFFKPKLGKPRPIRGNPPSLPKKLEHSGLERFNTNSDITNFDKYNSYPDPEVLQEIVLDKEEEENRAHKSSVAKITFKTAKQQFLASNPAAKRTLGATRKAQGKFVSPMIGVYEKQENNEPAVTDDRLKHIDPKMIELIESEIIDKGSPIGWEDIAGLELAKSVIQEAVVWPLLRPDMFTGLRRPPRGILLFGPPGTGKTLIGKCIAAQCKATFFSISASSLTSKWIGDGEKMVRALFAVARVHQPAVVFIDEIDSLLTQRSDTEHEATRRIKTEFLVQLDGANTGDEDRLLIVGATNRPQELDEAARRRLVKRLYIPLPDVQAREQIIRNLLRAENNALSPADVGRVAALAAGFSGADMKSLCSEAAMGPVRSVPLSQIATIQCDKVRPVCVEDFTRALQRVRPSVSQDDLGVYVKWNNTYGQGF